MACISKLAGGFAYDCDTGATGIENAFIVNKEDIVSFAFDPTTTTIVKTVTLAAGAKAYRIDTPKRTLVVTESLKVNEGALNALSFSASLTITAVNNFSLRTNVLQAMPNGSFVLFTKEANATYRVYGLYYGLSATAYDRTTHDNGNWITVTMGTPEQFIGEDSLQVQQSTYVSLYGAAVY
nr:MAG TPA: hypothetical protein [Bacteriophage sp.]